MSTSAQPSTHTTYSPSILAYVASFLLVGVAWGLTTPFIRRAAVDFKPPSRPWLEDGKSSMPLVQRRLVQVWYKVVDLVSHPRYAIPLAVNLTGSVWFYVLVGGAGRCFSSLFAVMNTHAIPNAAWRGWPDCGIRICYLMDVPSWTDWPFTST